MAAVVLPRSVEAADDFEQWWNTQGEWVEPPNLRRDGESGVQRLQARRGGLLYCKRQIGHLYRSLWHPLGFQISSEKSLQILRGRPDSHH